MDAHAFKILGAGLLRLLDGCRIEKIHAPAPGTLVLRVFAAGHKLHLAFRFERQKPLIFLFGQNTPPPENPKRPTAEVMLLRKYLMGRRLSAGLLDWPQRRLALPVPRPQEGPAASAEVDSLWLLLDLRQGPSLVRHLPENFNEPPLWPDEAALAGLSAPESAADASVWLQYPPLTPLLRHTLAHLEPKEGLALVMDLQADNDSLFAYAKSGQPALCSAWPLPEGQMLEEGLAEWLPDNTTFLPADLAARFSALALASQVGQAAFFKDFGQAKQKAAERPGQRELKKLARLLNSLAAEEKRLHNMVAMKESALRIQENLWRLADKEAKLKELALPGPDGASNADQLIALNPRLTVMENMRHMFHQADRGERGLAMLEPRKAEVRASMDALQNRTESRTAPIRAGIPAPAAGRKKKDRALKDVARFISSDGYTLLRGKNAKGNHALLRLGQPYDIWMHAETGPSAHLIIRRAHGADEVPERTLRQAACLVGLKSSMRTDDKAPIMCAYLRHVQAVKGASPGTVRVAKAEKTLLAALDPELETLLRAPEELA